MMAEALDVEWTDISVEQWREYRFPGGDTIRINLPKKLNVSTSGGHRIEDSQGYGHYIPKGWIYLRWDPHPNQPTFVK